MTDASRLTLSVFAGVFGLLLGSFANACIFRVPRNCMSVLRGRSLCPRCRKLIAWHDNLPLLSWLILGGKCRSCAKPISMRYPAVELLAGALVLWLAVARLYPGSLPARLQSYAIGGGWDPALLWSVQVFLVMSLLVASFIDIDFKILPDGINYAGLGLGLVLCTAVPALHLGGPLEVGWPVFARPTRLPDAMPPMAAAFVASLWGAFVGAGVTYVVRVGGELVFRREAMGLGDVKLMAFLGAWLGWKAALILFVLASLYGTLYALAQFPFTRKLRGVELWFGPFLAMGAVTMILASAGIDRAFEIYANALRPPR